MGTMRPSCGVEAYFCADRLEFCAQAGPNLAPHREKWPGCVCSKTAAAVLEHTHPLNEGFSLVDY